MSAVIYHNPACGTSRNVLAILRAAGAEPEVVEYLEAGWTEPQLQDLFAAAGLSPREALRTKGTPAEDLGLTAVGVSDADLVAAMVAHPVLVNRPFVRTARGVALCRPSERVLDLLERLPAGPLLKEDGEPIIDAQGNRLV
jgi:arsenate reductase (glutaredoxin)